MTKDWSKYFATVECRIDGILPRKYRNNKYAVSIKGVNTLPIGKYNTPLNNLEPNKKVGR